MTPTHSGPVTDEEALPRARGPAFSGQVLGVGSARAAHGLELGVGEDATGHEVPRKQRAVVAFGRRGRRHRRRLDEARRVGLGAEHADTRAVGVEDAGGERARGRGLRCDVDRQRPGILEGPGRSGVQLGARVRQRPLARRVRSENGGAGREEGEEVKLLGR
nr:hypothetical protein [Rubricoccus marinus]